MENQTHMVFRPRYINIESPRALLDLTTGIQRKNNQDVGVIWPILGQSWACSGI